jgi:adenylate cyclase
MERFINILIIDKEPKIRVGLKEILVGGGNNTLLADSIESASEIIDSKEIGLILVGVDNDASSIEQIERLKNQRLFRNNYILMITNESLNKATIVKGINKGAVDYITYPFNPNLVRSKIDVFKSLFYKDQRIGQLLENIFPSTILEELGSAQKFSPKRVENGVVLFTDFVDFSSKARDAKPLKLIRKLEYYFTEFDKIIERYNLEKIKTIGDAYMALSGVTEEEPMPATRACLAAMEMRDFMRTERDVAIAMGRDFWEIRIGLHMGPLVAGIIGSKKYSFDVWGDTVNIASRAEAATEHGNITITSNIAKEVAPYFELESRGQIEIHKRGGTVEMFYLKKLKDNFGLFDEGRSPKPSLREKCGLPTMDFENLRKEIITRMKSLLPDNVSYHDIPHTLNVEKAALRYAQLEGINEYDTLLLRTAVLLHDSGFIRRYHKNEDFGIQIARSVLPEFGYGEEQIEIISGIISATKFEIEPTTILEKIMCDADHDYLGRPDYHSIANKLRNELANYDETFTQKEWIQFQLSFLENNHQYYTETARNIREQGKLNRIQDLKKRLEKID